MATNRIDVTRCESVAQLRFPGLTDKWHWHLTKIQECNLRLIAKTIPTIKSNDYRKSGHRVDEFQVVDSSDLLCLTGNDLPMLIDQHNHSSRCP
jgi:hypothetical protein